MTPRRIAYVLNIFPKLSETFITTELAELRRRGVEVRILSLLPPRDEIHHQIVRRAGLDELTTYNVSAFPEILKEFRPDLLHAHFAREAAGKARELSAQTGVPFTFTAHGYDIHRKPPPDFHERAAAARAVVTVSNANAAFIHQTFKVPRAHIHVISCGIDTEQFRPGNPCASPAGPPLILCVARHVAVKNLGLLLEVCALLRDRGACFHCVMVGDGPLRGELEARRSQLGLEGMVEMPGPAEQTEVVQWWQRASLGVLTSQNEGMPVCLLEAAACGVPVVATGVGGVPELVEPGVTGLLCPEGDARAFASAVESLLTDLELRKRMGAAARLRAEQRFSVVRQVDSLLSLWTGLLEEAPGAGIKVADPFGAAQDKELPALDLALTPAIAWSEFKRRLPRLSGAGTLRLRAIRVTRHKPGRRCVVEYDVVVKRSDQPKTALTLIGKARARRSGNEGFRLQQAIWRAGFDSQCADGISVPEPVGVIAKFKMWFQRKVPGVTATELLSGPGGPTLARRVAEALHKLHQAGIPTAREHTMAHELKILRDCFARVANVHPEWTERLRQLMAACDKLAAAVPAPRTCGIHRDFYPSQVIVDGGRLWLIDFDLYCQGDPALDAGNFIGHVTEQAWRDHGRPDALGHVEAALENRFVELHGEPVRAAVRAYATLTLARHIFLSTRFPERAHLGENLLSLTEARLEIG